MAGVIGLRGPDIEKRDALRGFQVEWADADRPYVRPHTGLPVLTTRDGAPDVRRHVFGFSRKYASFNARADRLDDGRMWSRLFGKDAHHGVAPVSYILEWGDLGDGRGKRPFRIERRDGAAMCVPALVGSSWDGPDDAFALVTVEPNRFVAAFHDRMIGQLADGQIEVWLQPEAHGGKGAAQVRACLRTPPDDELVAYPLREDVGAARHDDVAAMEAIGPPIDWSTLPKRSRQATL